jgi:prepilin-type N-terminal cleavage/methylation domain-containing protein
MRGRGEAGFTLIEVIVVAALVAVMLGALGAFYLGGATPAVAAAARDVTAAFDEARQTAVAFDAATVVFEPAPSGFGYAARVYRRSPGDTAFAGVNGPDYPSTVTLSETAAPLGAPGFAFSIDHAGTITAFRNFTVASGGTSTACPAAGHFTLHLADARDVRTIDVPCAIALDAGAPLVTVTPVAAVTPSPAAPWTCPPGKRCGSPAPLTPPTAPPCPAGTTPDPATPGLCDPPTPPAAAPTTLTTATPTPASAATPNAPATSGTATPSPPAGAATCPPGYVGTYPYCKPAQPPTPSADGALIEQFEAEASGPYEPRNAYLYSTGVTCADGEGCQDLNGDAVQKPVGTWPCSPISGSWFHYHTIANAATFEYNLASQDASDDPGQGSTVTASDLYCSNYAL